MSDRRQPWEETETHDVVEHSETVYKCRKCGRMTTSKKRFEQQECDGGDD